MDHSHSHHMVDMCRLFSVCCVSYVHYFLKLQAERCHISHLKQLVILGAVIVLQNSQATTSILMKRHLMET